MALHVIGKEIIDTNINIIKEATCPSLSGRSTLTYTLAKTAKGEIIMRIDKNSGSGKFNNHWVYGKDIDTAVGSQNTPLNWSALYPLFIGQSINTAGFFMAALLKEGIIKADNKGYVTTAKKLQARNSRRQQQ